MYKRTICIMGRVLDQEDGLGVYSYNLLKNMIMQDQGSFYLILLKTPRNLHMFNEFKNVKMQVIPAQNKYAWDQIHVPHEARKYHADIIFNPKFSLPLFCSIPGVFVLQGSDWYVNPGNYTWWDNFYIRLMLPIYCRKAARLLSISQFVVDDLVKFAKIDSGKTTVTYAAPSPHFRPIEERMRLKEFALRYNLPEHFILSVSRVYHTGYSTLPTYPGGNVEGLISGYREYRGAGGNLPLVIAGKDIDKYLHSEGYSPKDLDGISFTGFVPHDDIVNLYNLAEFFVLTTLCESFALPLVEAMASGCPAIVPLTGACPEIAGGAAMLINPLDNNSIANAMLALDKSEMLRKNMAAAGLERTKVFTWEKTAELTLKVFKSISIRQENNLHRLKPSKKHF